jgi:hypothetical protein
MAYISRATRFPLNLSLHYRASGTILWHEGSTVDISRTGILFQAGQDLPLRTALEMRIEIPSPSKVTLICRGPVVRKQEPIFSETRSVMAALVRACRVLPKKTVKNPT